MAANLKRLADKVAGEGMKLCIEAVSAERLPHMLLHHFGDAIEVVREADHPAVRLIFDYAHVQAMDGDIPGHRSEEHTSELQSLMRISYAVFCFKKKETQTQHKL